MTVARESPLWVDPAEIPAADDVARLGKALTAGPDGERDELMANVAAYSGLRWGESPPTVPQVDTAARVITVDRKVIEVAGHLYVEAPKNRKRRRTIYPRTTPSGRPTLAERLAVRIEQARAEQDSGSNPLGLVFPSPHGKHWRSSNFNRNVLKRAYLEVGWRDADGNGERPRQLAQPAARLLHHGPVHLEARRNRRVAHGRTCQLPDHARHVLGSVARVIDRARQATA